MTNLRLLQLGDSALPVGGYTHSWGLETAITRGRVNDAASLERWTRGWLRRSLGPFEGVIVGASCRNAGEACWPEVIYANELVEASLNPLSLRNASREMAQQLLQLAATWQWSREQVDVLRRSVEWKDAWHYCVAYGLLAAFAGATAEEAICVFLNQAVLGMIAAGVRGIPIGHTHAQQILAYLHDDIAELARLLAGQDLATAGSGSPFYEVLCHEQPRLYTRLFRS